MGESKHRKATDSNYGKSSAKIRGLIISPPIEIDGETIYVRDSTLDTQELRSSLLYWDKLTLPVSSIVYVGGGTEADFLESCGILDRRRHSLNGSGAESLIIAQAMTLRDLELESPGAWSIGGGQNSLLIKSKVAIPEQGSLLQLYNAIPVPKEDTPLSDILEFKNKRTSELLAFREYMDQLSKEISSSADSVDELNNKLKLLDEACSNLVKTTKEYQLPIYISNLNASLNFDYKIVGVAAAVWAGCKTLGMSTTTSTIATITSTAASMISLKSDIKFRSLKRPASPFKYAYYIQRDLG